MRQYFMFNQALCPSRKIKKSSYLTNKRISAISLLFLLSPLTFADVFINEIHYDNTGADAGEAIEVAGPSGTDLTGWSLVLYNGSANSLTSYKTTNLSGILPNQQDGFGTLEFSDGSIQNGAPDGIALVDASNNVIQFLSYEGVFTASGGPADGITSTDINVSESSSTPVGHSLQLAGTGSQSDDFTWQPSAVNTFGEINTNQTFGGGGSGVDTAPTIIGTTPVNLSGVVALDTNIEISFSEAVNVAAQWSDIHCSVSGQHSTTISGGPQHYTLDPDVDFVHNEVCTVNVMSNQVSDVDDNDPPDNMAADFSFSFGTLVDSPILINELDADTAGSDTLEFIELYDGGVGNTSLDGLVVVLYNGSDDKSYNTAFDLDGFTTNNDGFFVLGNAAVLPPVSLVINNNSLQNGADAVAIYFGNEDDYPNDTPVSGFSLIDAVVYDTSDADDSDLLNILTPEQNQINENGNNNKDDDSIARVPDGGTAIVTESYLQQTPTPGESNVASAQIFEIQGNGLTSPFEGQFVSTENNVVTALDSNGFFIQTPTALSDGNIETSDGIFVFTGSAPTVSVGDLVKVTGQIVEFFGFTEFTNNVQVTVTGKSYSLPPEVFFNKSIPSPDQPQAANEIERYEGMIVAFHGVASAATDRFGDVAVVAGSKRPFREPGIAYPGETGLPVWDGNPEMFEVDPDALGLTNESFFAGQKISATGPLGFSFGDYQIWPTSLKAGPVPKNLLKSVRPRNTGEMTLGALNMFRLFDSVDTPMVDDEVVDSEEYAVRLQKISRFVRDVMDAPDILAVSEVESLSVLDDLANQIHGDDNTINYTAYLEEGNDVGGIDVGFLVRSSVEVDEVVQFGKEEIFSFDNSLLNDRPPLLLKGRAVTNGSNFPIQVIAVHNRSLSNIDSSERVRAKRLAQAQFVANLVQDIQSSEPHVNLVVTGDFNAYQFTDGYVDVLGQISGTSIEEDNLLWEPSPVSPPLLNQVNKIPQAERYSFVFRGNAQALDHALITRNLKNLVTHFEYARGNSDVPGNLVTDASTSKRASDHDGVVMFLLKDSDNDRVTDNIDVCPATSIPEKISGESIKPNHFALLDSNGSFDSRGQSEGSFSIADTLGCSCEQILEQQGLGQSQFQQGCSIDVMKSWITQ